MISIQTKARIGTDGRLDVQLSAEYREKSVNVIIVVEPAEAVDSDKSVSASSELRTESEIWQQARRESEVLRAKWESEAGNENGWPLSFIADTYGSCADDPLERLPQGELETREEID